MAQDERKGTAADEIEQASNVNQLPIHTSVIWSFVCFTVVYYCMTSLCLQLVQNDVLPEGGDVVEPGAAQNNVRGV